MKKFILIALVLCSGAVYAETPGGLSDQDSVHFAAHVGASYAINTFTYGLARKGFHFEKTDSLIFAAFTTLVVGAMWKVLESNSLQPINGSDFKTSMFRNALGTGLSAGTMIMFDF